MPARAIRATRAIPLLGLPGPAAVRRAGAAIAAAGRRPGSGRGPVQRLRLPGAASRAELLAAPVPRLRLLVRCRCTCCCGCSYGRPFWRSLGWVRPRAGLLARSRVRRPGAGARGRASSAWLLQTPDIDTPMKDLLTRPLLGAAGRAVRHHARPAVRGAGVPRLPAAAAGALAGRGGRASLLAALPFALLHGPQYAWSLAARPADHAGRRGVRLDAPADRFHRRRDA